MNWRSRTELRTRCFPDVLGYNSLSFASLMGNLMTGEDQTILEGLRLSILRPLHAEVLTFRHGHLQMEIFQRVDEMHLLWSQSLLKHSKLCIGTLLSEYTRNSLIEFMNTSIHSGTHQQLL